MTAELSEDDRGKTVVYGTERIGTVDEVSSGTAYVDPEFDHVPEDLAARLGWDEGDERYPLDEEDVTEVINAEVRLREVP